MGEYIFAAGSAIYGALKSITLAGAAKVIGGAVLSAGSSYATAELTKPDKPDAPPPPPITSYATAPPEKKIAEPSAPPTEGVASSNAFKAEERRRLLAGMPQATQNIFSSPGGDQSGARLRKPRLLGGGVGQTTTGV